MINWGTSGYSTGQSFPTVTTLYFNVIFILFLLIGINHILRRTMPQKQLNDGELIVHSKEPQPRQISVDATKLIITKDDTSMVTASINDKFGSLIPSNNSKVMFRIEGPGHFINGNKNMTIKADKGKATIPFIPENNQKNTYITASSENLIPGRIRLNIQKDN